MSENRNNKNNMSNHILPTSSNLLGLCFVILTFIKLTKFGAETLIDEVAAIAIVLFLTSSVFSYADIIFLIGLSLLALMSVIIAFELIR